MRDERKQRALQHYARGQMLGQARRYVEALSCFEQVVSLEPDRLDARTRVSTCLMFLGRLDLALSNVCRVLEAQPDHVDAGITCGCILEKLGRPHDALLVYEQILRYNPNHPTAHLNRGVMLLLMGKLEAGWREFEWRWRSPGFTTPARPFTQPLWDGSPLAGRTLFLHAEQGLGDAIQFIRFVPELANASGKIVVECATALARLFATVPGIDACIPRGHTPARFEVQAPLFSLAGILGVELDTIPQDIPYLTAPPEGLRIETRADALNVGLVWAGSPTHANDAERSISLACLGPLLQVPGVRFFSLQKSDAARDLVATPGFERVVDLGGKLRDFAETAHAMTQLDLIITVDTAVAHLAGALGKPVWNLIPFAPDWRWGIEREDSPWYPTMRLFRQRRRGDWDEVVSRVALALCDDSTIRVA